MNQKINYLLSEDMRIILLEDILKMSSSDLYQLDLHYDVCHAIAQQRSSNLQEQQLLTNLLILKSKLARSVTAIIHFLQTSDTKIIELCLSPKILSLIDTSLLNRITIIPYLGKDLAYFEKSFAIRLLAKALIHGIFRLLPNRKTRSRIFVRGWVDVTYKMYPNECQEGVLLLYPFAFNIIRQAKFLMLCHSKNIRYKFSGLPYPTIKIAYQIFAGRACDQILVDAEMIANYQHGLELSKLNPIKIFTSDEFECGSFVLYNSLIKAEITVINTAHGVGQYCPYICYSEFIALSNTQVSFYKKRNQSIIYSIKSHSIKATQELDPYKLSTKKPPAIVLVHQTFYESSMIAESDALKKLDIKLTKISSEINIKYFIKMHPNYNPSILSWRNNQFFGEKVYQWTELKEYCLIFVTVNSSVFFDVQGIAPILVYTAPTFYPSLYFGSHYEGVTFTNLRKKVLSLLSIHNWLNAVSKHIDQGDL